MRSLIVIALLTSSGIGLLADEATARPWRSRWDGYYGPSTQPYTFVPRASYYGANSAPYTSVPVASSYYHPYSRSYSIVPIGSYYSPYSPGYTLVPPGSYYYSPAYPDYYSSGDYSLPWNSSGWYWFSR